MDPRPDLGTASDPFVTLEHTVSNIVRNQSSDSRAIFLRFFHISYYVQTEFIDGVK